MKMAWKKWIAASWGIRIVLALLYIYILFTASLNHTCHLACHQRLNCHRAYANSCPGLRCDAESETLLCGNVSIDITCTDSQSCLACLYSLLCKSSEINQKVSSLAIEAPSVIEVLPHLNFIKKPEYLSSVSLRAPPDIIS